MNPEIISLTSAGLTYGAVWYADKRAISRAAGNTNTFESEVTGQAIEEAAARRQAFTQSLGRKAVKPLACLAAATAGFGVFAATEQSDTEYLAPKPKIEVVVDHSGATGLSFGDRIPANEQINTIAGQFIDEDTKGEALIASGGNIRSTAIANIPKYEPFGGAPLRQATKLALDKSQNSNVLVITNGNSVGNTEALIKKAKRKDVKVFVANIEADSQATTELKAEKQLAEATGAKFWTVKQDNFDNVAKSVGDTISPANPESGGSSKWPLGLFAVLGIGGAIGLLRQKRRGQIIGDIPPEGVKEQL